MQPVENHLQNGTLSLVLGCPGGRTLEDRDRPMGSDGRRGFPADRRGAGVVVERWLFGRTTDDGHQRERHSLPAGPQDFTMAIVVLRSKAGAAASKSAREHD